VQNSDDDQAWADFVAPTRRSLITRSSVAVGLAATGFAARSASAKDVPAKIGDPGFRPIVPARDIGKSPWGDRTVEEPTPQPRSIRPEGGDGLPEAPRPYTAIRSYHAHIYFDEDSYAKAARIRKWVIERFPVELGNWNLEPRGPHVTPSFYFGFTNDLLPVVVPWLQLNSLGLTILIHPNTDDPRADHLYYTLWVNRSQPVNAFNWKKAGEPGAEPVEHIFPNVVPTREIET